ncbi:uncharacterized protein [Apostichopus japonicus]
MFSSRIVSVNHYLHAPIPDLDVVFSDFRNSKVTQVPVLRIFGSTPAGQKTCLHIHGVFPYFYVPCDETEVTDKLLQQLALSIDTALQVGSGNANKYTQHVFKITAVSGRQLYGYRSSERQFLKIYFYNPFVLRRAAELLQTGAVMNKVFQPFECHVPFNLQFFIDYNLYGMNLINLAAVKFRKLQTEKPSNTDLSNCGESQAEESLMCNSVSTQHWDPSNIPGSHWLPDDVKRQSTCELEVDGVAADILNRLDLKDNVDTNPGLVAIWEDERQRREQLNQLSELMPPSSPERGEIPPQESEFDWLERLREVVEDELKDLKVHLPTPEERKKPSQDEEESPSVPASQQSSNQFVDHLSQQPASQSLNEEVLDPVIDEELASSFSQVSGGELSQALDKDLANLLMELGDDVVDPDSLLSTQTPPATQGEENSDEDEIASAEKQETFEMSQVWEKEEEDEDKSEDENLIPEMDETSAFSQPGDLSTQLSQLDGQNDPRPEQKKKSKLQMVQEFRAIKASHQLQKANPSSPSSMHSSDHHSLQIAMTEDVDSGVVDGSKPKLVAGNIAIESTSASAVGSMPDGVSQSGQPNKSRKGSQGVEERQVSISQQEGTEGTKTGNKSVARIKISSGNVDAAANIVSMGSSFKSKGIPKHTPKKRGRPPSNLTKMKANPKDDDLQENVQSGVDSTHGNDFKAVVFGGGLKIEQPKGGIKVTKKKGRPPSIGKQSGVNKINPDVESMSSSPADKLSSQKNDAVIHRLISAKNSLKVKGKKRLMTKRKQLDFESNSQHSSTENMSQSNTATSVGNNVGSKASLGKPMSTKKRGRPPKAKQSIHTDGAVCKVKSDSEEKSDSHRGQNRKKVSDNLEKKKTSDIGMGLEVQIDDSFKSQSKKVKPLTLKKGKVLFKNKKEEKTFFERVNNSQPSTSQNSSSYLSNTLYNRNAHSEDDVSPHKLVYKVKKKRGRPPLKFKQGGNDGKVNSNSPQFESIHSSQSTVIVSDDGGSPSASHASGSQSPKSAKKTKKKKKRKKKGKRRSEDDPNDNTITVSGSSSSDGPEVGSRDRLGSEDESLKTIIVKRQKDNKRDEQFYIQNTKVPSSMYPPHKSASAVTGLPSSTQHTVLKRRGRPPKKHKSIITSNQQDGHHLTPHQAFQRAHPVGLPRLKQVHVSLNKVSITGEQMDGSDSVDESTIVASASENCESESLSQTDRSLSGQPTFTSSPVTKRLEESMKDNRGVTNDSLEIKGTKKKRHKKHKTLGMRTKMVYQIGDKKWKKDTVKVKNRTPKLSQKALFSTSSVSDSSKLNMSDSQSVHSMTSDAENEPHEILISPAADDTRKETSLHVTPSCKLDEQDSVQNDGAAREAIFERGEDAIQIATAGNENIAKEITLHSKLVGGHSINLDEFPAEKLLTMSEISPKVILYRFGKCPSITAPATHSKQESSPVVGLGETSSVCNEALTALPRSSDTSPSLDCSLYQRKYIPANSKAAKLKKSTSTRMRKVVDYTRLAGLTKYYKGSRKLLTGKDAVMMVEEEDSSKENTSEEVVDLTISSPEEEEQKTKSLESGSDDIIEGFSSSALNESSSTSTKGRRKSKLSKGSHKKAKRKSMSPDNSPINKPELAFLVTPPKIVRENSKQPSLDSPSISNTPQADSSSPGKAVKRGRGRPRKLKLNEDDKKQRKKVKALSKKSPKIKGVEITFTAKKKIENHLSGKNALEMSIDKDGKSRGGQKSGGNGAFDQRDQSLLKSTDDKLPLVGEGDGSRILTSLGNLSSEEIQEKGAAQSEKSASMVSYEDEDGRYPFLKTPPGSPYRDALWNLAYPSPVFSLPKASPPKFWSPTEQSVENVPPPLAACPSLKTLKSNSKDELLSYVSQDTDRDISDGTSGSPPIDDWDSDQSNDHQSSPVEIGITPMELFEEVEEITSDAETGRNVSQEITSGSSVEQISSTEEEEDSRCKGTGDKVVNSTEHHQDGTREMEDVVQDDSKDLQVDGVLEKESHLEVATVEESSSQKQLSSYEHVDGDGDRDDIGKQEADNEKGSIQEIATDETVEGKDGLDPSKVGSDVDERDTQDIVGGGDCVHSDKDTQGVRSMQEDTAEGVANGNRNDSTVDCPGIISRKVYNSDAPGGDCKTTADPGRDGERVVDDDDDEGEPLIPYPMSIPDSATPVSSESEDESPLLGLLEGVSQGDFSSRDAVAVDERDEEEKTVDKENNVLPEQNSSDRIAERNSGDKNALQEETHPSLNAGELSCPDQQTGGDGNQKSNHEAETCDHEKHAVGDIQLSSNQVKESGDHREEISYPEKRAGDHMKQTSEDGSQILGIQNETPGRGELILDHSKEERNEGVQNGNDLLEGNKGSEDTTGAKEDTKWQSREGENGGNVFIEEKRRLEESISAKESATEQRIEGEDGNVLLKENKGSEEGTDTKEAATEQKSEGVENGNILSEDDKGLEERAGAEKDAKTQRREEEDSSIPSEENNEFKDKRDVKEQHQKGDDNGNVLLEENRRSEERTAAKEAAKEQRSEGTENGIVLLAEKKGAEDRTGPKEQQCERGEEGGSVTSEGNEMSEQRMSPVIEFQGSDTQVKMLTSLGDSETSQLIQNGSDSMSDRNEGVSVNVREAEYRESPNADCSQVEQDDGDVQEKRAMDVPQQQSIKEIDSYGKHARGEGIGGKGEKRVIDSVSSMNTDQDKVDETTADRTSPVLPFQGTLSQAQSLQTGSSGEQNIQEVVLLEQRAELVVKEQERDNTEAAIMREGGSPVFEFQGTLTQMSNLDQSSLYRDNESARAAAFISDPESSFDIESQVALQSEEIVGDGGATAKSDAVATGDPWSGIDQKERNPNQSKLTLGKNTNRVVIDSVDKDQTVATVMVEESEDSSQSPEESEISKLDRNKTDRDGEEAARDILIVGSISPFENVSQEASGSSSSGKSKSREETGERRPALDFESTFMIEHSQFVLSDSGDNVNHQEIREGGYDPESSISLLESDVSDCDHRDDDVSDNEEKSPKGKAKAGRNCKGESKRKKKKNKKEKSRKRKREKSEKDSSETKKKKRKSTDLGDVGATKPRIKMTFRKVRASSSQPTRNGISSSALPSEGTNSEQDHSQIASQRGFFSQPDPKEKPSGSSNSKLRLLLTRPARLEGFTTMREYHKKQQLKHFELPTGHPEDVVETVPTGPDVAREDEPKNEYVKDDSHASSNVSKRAGKRRSFLKIGTLEKKDWRVGLDNKQRLEELQKLRLGQPPQPDDYVGKPSTPDSSLMHGKKGKTIRKSTSTSVPRRKRLNTMENEVIEALMDLSAKGGTGLLSHGNSQAEMASTSRSLSRSPQGMLRNIDKSTTSNIPDAKTTEQQVTMETDQGVRKAKRAKIACHPDVNSEKEYMGKDDSVTRRMQDSNQPVAMVTKTDVRKAKKAKLALPDLSKDEEVIIIEEASPEPVSGKDKDGNVSDSVNIKTQDSNVGQAVFVPVRQPPTRREVRDSLTDYGLTDCCHRVPYWQKGADVPSFVRETANMQVQLNQNLPDGLKEALPPSSSLGLNHWRMLTFLKDQTELTQGERFSEEEGNVMMKTLIESAASKRDVVVTPTRSPPSSAEVTKWLQSSLKRPRPPPASKEPASEKNSKEDEVSPPDSEISPMSCDKSGDLLRSPTATVAGEDPPSPFLQDLIDDIEPSTPPPMSDTPPSPLSCQTPQTLPCHSTPMTTGRTKKLNQPIVTPILVTSSKKNASKLKCRVSLVDPVKETRPRVVTPAQASMATPLLKKGSFVSQLEGPSLKNTGGFKYSQSNLQDAKALHENQNLTLMSLELHVHTRGKLRPDPEFDPVRAIFFCVASENYGEGVGEGARSEHLGVITVDNPNKNQLQTQTSSRPALSTYGLPDIEVINVTDEARMIEELLKLVKKHDPDILVGFEIQQLSWGYLFDRATALEIKLCAKISRLPDNERESHFSSEKDAYGANHTSEVNIAGRIVLNIWRLLRHEIALNVYTFENVAYHVLHQRVPLFSLQDLSAWYDHQTHLLRWRVVEHYMYRVTGNLKILKKLDLIGRTSELARVFGIEFFSVLSRGSQYRVESMMLRQAKSQNFVAISPSVQQRAVMKAPECVALILEPESRLYEDPVIVLDFQSLYPSMMIGYNYCFSTCLGRVEHIAKGGEFVLGCTTHYIPPAQIKKLLDSGGLHVSPNGVVFVRKHVRHGILPRMLDQILKTRIMVKKGIKDHKDDKVLQRMLDNRQLGLKLIANVTYGYTSASFSGRMPCIEVGDSIVMKARETLERSIHLVENTPKWGAKVVYGDTDSMFVMVKGATKERAFQVGKEIVAAVSKVNPKPVKLKLEKVYKPCVLQAKKRYVGFKYESPDQVEPELEAKGIETIRRDTCPAVAKILEKALKIVFTTQNISQVKQYVQKQFQKIVDGRINLQELVFAKEYRGRQYYKPGACVPALELTKRSLSVDRRAEPRVGERVPYLIVNGVPGLPLIQLVRRPEEMVSDPSLIINSTYYITRQIIPALNRVFGIMGVETLQWFQELPRTVRVSMAPTNLKSNARKGTISQYFCSLNCAICDQLTKTGLCDDCRRQPQLASAVLNRRIQDHQRAWIHLTKICRSCSGFAEHEPSCISTDCPIRHQVAKTLRKMNSIPHLVQLIRDVPADSSQSGLLLL